MKKICFSCVVILCTMLLVMSSSCSKESSLKLPEEKIESSELLQTLKSVNNDFMANKLEVRGKGWGKKSIIEPSTELSKEEKELIYSSLSVAAYSFKYWETTLP